MGLQSSGSISLSNIAGEFGGSAPHSLSEYYGVASGVPASGTISLANFYGTSSRPIGFINFSDPAISNLTVQTGTDYRQMWQTEFEHTWGGYHPIDAVTVNKGGTNYLIVMTSNGYTNTYPKDMNPMRSANMVMCNIDAHPDLDVWTRVNGQNVSWLHSNWYSSDPDNGYDVDGNVVYASYTDRNTERGSRLVVCKVNNAVTVWQPALDNQSDGGIYRDYVNSPSEALPSGYWGRVPEENDPMRSGSFRTEGFVEEYASSETSTIVITMDTALRTTDGYNYLVHSSSGMSSFPNQGVNYINDSDEVKNHYWNAKTIAYGNGVWVIGRENPSITHSNGGFGDQDTRYSIIHSTDDGLTWNISNSITSVYNHYQDTGQSGYLIGDISRVVFGNGVFLAVGTSGLHRSTDGTNWTKLSPTWSGAYNDENTWGYDQSFTHDLTGHGKYFSSQLQYGNGMFIAHYGASRVRVGSRYLYPGYLYSTDNGETWTSPKSSTQIPIQSESWDPAAPQKLRFVEGADIFLSASHLYADFSNGDSANDRLVGMYRLE